MRGVLVDDALKVITLENFDKVMELLKGTPFRGQLAFEYLPHGKINSVAPHETPYRRNLPGNGIAVVMWDEHTPELEARARTLVEQLTAMVKVPGMHYGNFSACPCHCVVRGETLMSRRGRFGHGGAADGGGHRQAHACAGAVWRALPAAAADQGQVRSGHDVQQVVRRPPRGCVGNGADTRLWT